jgi:hypothetical protein
LSARIAACSKACHDNLKYDVVRTRA